MLNKYASAISAHGAASGNVHPMDGVILLHEKGRAHLARAAKAREERRFEDHAKEIERALTIMAGLDSMLDYRRGGYLAIDLHRFYLRMIRSRAFAGGRHRPGLLASIIRRWSAMIEAWREAAKIARRQETGMGRSGTAPSAAGSSRTGSVSIFG